MTEPELSEAEREHLELIESANVVMSTASRDLNKPGGRAALAAAFDRLDAARARMGLGSP